MASRQNTTATTSRTLAAGDASENTPLLHHQPPQTSTLTPTTPSTSSEYRYHSSNSGKTRERTGIHHHRSNNSASTTTSSTMPLWLPLYRIRLPSIRRPPLQVPKALTAIPLPALQLIGLLIAINALVWLASGIVLHYNPSLASFAVLAYTLGLRHALDADHIAAIDLVTRRLIASGRRPVAVGTFFSLGHSTVVVVTCVVVAATAGALSERFEDFARAGNIVGTSVSAAFLLLLCAGNAWVLGRLVRRLREELERQHQQHQGADEGANAPRDVVDVIGDEEAAVREEENAAEAADGRRHHGGGGDAVGAGGAAGAAESSAAGQLSSSSAAMFEGGGLLAYIFRKLFKIIDRPWKMFPLGIVFGLGFDTSSEIALLGLAGLQGANGTSMWLILMFPILFTAGMCLLDTTDGALMMALYTSKAFSRDVVAILYYSIVLTGITIFVSAFIGVVQLLSLVLNVAEPEGPFWDGVAAIGDHFDVIGGCICGVFLAVGVGSVLVYRPWRRRMEARRRRRTTGAVSTGEGSGSTDISGTTLQGSGGEDGAPSRV